MRYETNYICYPRSTSLFNLDEIFSLFTVYLNENIETIETINSLFDYFELVDEIKKGKSHEVVLKGNEILEAILLKNN